MNDMMQNLKQFWVHSISKIVGKTRSKKNNEELNNVTKLSAMQLLLLRFHNAHLCHPVTGQRQTLTVRRELEEISTCLGVSSDPMSLWIFSNSCPLKLLLVWRRKAEMIIVKRLIHERNYVTRVPVEPRLWDQGQIMPLPSRSRSRFVFALTPSFLTQQLTFSKIF